MFMLCFVQQEYGPSTLKDSQGKKSPFKIGTRALNLIILNHIMALKIDNTKKKKTSLDAL